MTLGILMSLTANWIVSGRFAFPPGGYGILFGRMLQDGIVSRYLDDHCPNPKLKLCPFRHELPRDADAFLWGQSVFNRLGRFAGLGDEMETIVLGSLREYPRLADRESANRNPGSATESRYRGRRREYRVAHLPESCSTTRQPLSLQCEKRASSADGLSFETINRIHVPIALFAMAMLPIIFVIGLRAQAFSDLGALAATVGVAFLSNAFICGALSNPHHRYGARLIWLAPLVVILAVAPLLGEVRDLINASARLKGLTANEPGG